MKRVEVWLCCGVIALGLCVALYSDALRVKADAAYKAVIVLVDWHSLASLAPPTVPGAGEDRGAPSQDPPAATQAPAADRPAPGSGGPAAAAAQNAGHARREALLSPAHWELVKQLPGAMLCYGEETLGSLLAQGILVPARQRTLSPSYEVAVERYADDIYYGALRHGYLAERGWFTGGKLVVAMPDLPAEEASQLPVCWLSEVRQVAREQGVELILRPSGSEFLGAQGIARTLDFAKGQQLMLFQGPAVLGYPAQLDVTARLMQQARLRFGWVEFDEQDGGAQLAAKLAPGIVRVHSIPPEEMQNYGVDGAVLRLLRAVRERNIRCLYLRPFVRGSVIDDTGGSGYREELFEVNRQYFTALAAGLRQEGFSIARDAAPPPDVPAALAALRAFCIAWAGGAALILLLLLWFPHWPRRVWWTLRIVNVLAALAAGVSGIVLALALLATALAFPLLGFWLALWLYQRVVQNNAAWCPRRWLMALAALVIASAASVVGGLLIHGALWDAETMLKVGQFRGVTPALAIPVLCLAAYAWQAETLQEAFDRATLRLMPYWQRFIALWTSPIRYGDVAFIMIALGAVGIVLLRSGNDSPLEVLSVETWFRGSLEQLFSVRPRTKELLGHPMLVVFLLSLVWRNRLALLFGLAALLGQVSILNTFCHLHTPLLLTLQRVGMGLGLGLINGAFWGALVLLCNWLWHRLHHSPPATGAAAASDR